MKRPGLVFLLLATACVACATAVRVEFDPREDFSRYRTWAWLPLTGEDGEAPGSGDLGLDALVRASVERELGARGYHPAARHPPDLYVTCRIEIAREIEIRTETPASQTLLSHHQSPSYIVWASERRVRVYETGTLAIEVTGGRERRPVWRGVATKRVRRSFKSHADAVVVEMFDRFPPRSHPRSGGGPPARGAGCASPGGGPAVGFLSHPEGESCSL